MAAVPPTNLGDLKVTVSLDAARRRAVGDDVGHAIASAYTRALVGDSQPRRTSIYQRFPRLTHYLDMYLVWMAILIVFVVDLALINGLVDLWQQAF